MATLKIKQSEHKKKTVVTIKRKEVDEMGKVLGVHITMSGTWKKDIQDWISKSRCFAGLVRRANFTRTCDVRLCPFLWVPKFRYPVGIVGFSKSQL